MEYSLFTLPNGIRVIHKQANDTGITHCCMVINAGSRDELPGKTGLAHFIEHLLFKGTQKRNTFQVLNRLEAVGGDLNAYTTKEQTCIHASFLDEHLDRALDLFSDVIFRSVFPEKALSLEKAVVLDELDSYKDSPEDQIYDDFDEIIYKNHPLGNNILGIPETIRGFSRGDILSFREQNYATQETVLGVYGNVSGSRLKKLAEKHFGEIPENPGNKNRVAVNGYAPETKKVVKNGYQAHCVLGGRSYPLNHEKKPALLVLNNLLGGPGMSSRLNLGIREKYGICYTIESSYSPMSDTGIFSIYFGTEKGKTDKCLALIHKELKKLREDKLGTTQIHQAKQRFKGQIALAEEARLAVILSMSKSLLDYGQVDSLEEIFRKIDAVTAGDLMEVAEEVLHPGQLSMLSFIPE